MVKTLLSSKAMIGMKSTVKVCICEHCKQVRFNSSGLFEDYVSPCCCDKPCECAACKKKKPAKALGILQKKHSKE